MAPSIAETTPAPLESSPTPTKLVHTGNGYRVVKSDEVAPGSFTQIPVIDFAQAYSDKLEDRQKVAALVRDACTRVVRCVQ
jgi:hypothetical protein